MMKTNSFFRPHACAGIIVTALMGVLLIIGQATAPFAQGETLDVFFDIKPCRCPNPLNVLTQGILTAAILGTDSYDVYDIDPGTIELEGVAPMLYDYRDIGTPYEGDIEDCDDCTAEGPDGKVDLVLRFDAEEVLEKLGEVSEGGCILLTIVGELFDGTSFGTPFVGKDMVEIFKGKKPGS